MDDCINEGDEDRPNPCSNMIAFDPLVDCNGFCKKIGRRRMVVVQLSDSLFQSVT